MQRRWGWVVLALFVASSAGCDFFDDLFASGTPDAGADAMLAPDSGPSLPAPTACPIDATEVVAEVPDGWADDIALDPSWLYFLSYASVYRVGVSGFPPPEAIAGTELNALHLALDSDRAYWTAGGAESLFSAPLIPDPAGRVLLVESSEVDPQNLAVALVVDGRDVFYTTMNPATLRRVPAAGGANEVLFRGPGYSAINDLTLDGGTIFFTYDDDSGTETDVMALDVVAGTSRTLVADQPGAGSIAVDSEHVFWTGVRDIRRAPREGGPPTVLSTGVMPNAITVLGGYVLFDDSRRIVRVPAAGGTPETLACGLDMTSIATDRTHVYWVADGFVLRAPHHIEAPRDCLTPCGASTPECVDAWCTCTSTSCPSGTECDASGSCSVCGGVDQPCCRGPEGTCRTPGFGCRSDGLCHRICGRIGEACCDSFTPCTESVGVCEGGRCCGVEGAECIDSSGRLNSALCCAGLTCVRVAYSPLPAECYRLP